MNALGEAGIAQVIRRAVLAFVAFSDDRRYVAAVTPRAGMAEFVPRPLHQFILRSSILLQKRSDDGYVLACLQVKAIG